MYRFVRIKTHPRLDLTGWYLAIPASAVELTMQAHKSAAQSMFLRFFRDPHLFDPQTGAAKNENAELHEPVKLAAGWLATAHRGLLKHGIIYMNTAHGLLFGENVEILEERESDEIVFPKGDDHKEGVRITISRWGDGQHYYLSASSNQVFSRTKFDSEADALAEARLYAFEKNIKSGDTFAYSREGG